MQRRIAAGPKRVLPPGLRPMALNWRRVTRPSGTAPRSYSGRPLAPRGIRSFFSRRRFFLGRGITAPRRRAAERGAAGSGGRDAADGAGRSGGAVEE
ncbi:hypothetical protein GCM10027074_75400 [Streptomyces deserti]